MTLCRVDRSGRLLIPVELRRQLHLDEGVEVLLMPTRDGLLVKSRAQSLKEARVLVQSHKRPKRGGSVVEDYLREKRREVRRRERLD